MNIPEELLYTKDHEWLQIDGHIATIGITQHAQNELGDIVYVDIDPHQETFNAGDTFGTIEAVKTVSDLFIPIKGKLLSVNEQLEPHPELVNAEPYGKGWMIKIEIKDPEELKTLLSAEAYKEIIS